MTFVKKIFSVFIVLTFILCYSACDDPEEVVMTLSESEAVEIIEIALQSNSGALTSNIEDVAAQMREALTSGEVCDTLYNEEILKNHEGNLLMASYTTNISYQLECNNLSVPQSATFTSSTDASYNTNRITNISSSTFNGLASSLQPMAAAMSINGNYNSTGTQDISGSNPKSVNSTFIADLTNIEVNKVSIEVFSGTGTFSLTGTSNGESFDYSGDLLFNTDGTATLTINGTVYEIDLN